MRRLTTFGLRTVRRRVLRRPPPPRSAGGATGPLAFDEVAGLLTHWRTRVIAEASRLPRWSGVPVAELDDHYGEVCEALLRRHGTHPYNDAEHLHNSLWQNLAWKRGHYYQSAARRNQPLENAAEPIASDCGLKVVNSADAAVVQDFMSELTEEEQKVFKLRFGMELSENKVAARLGVRQADVKRALYHAERKLADFTALSEAGRLCAKRADAIERLAKEGDRADRVAEAHAHLAACPACRMAFNGRRRQLARDTASLIAIPPADGDA